MPVPLSTLELRQNFRNRKEKERLPLREEEGKKGEDYGKRKRQGREKEGGMRRKGKGERLRAEQEVPDNAVRTQLLIWLGREGWYKP